MKLGSLFDGIGGFPLAGWRHGFDPVWASEIEAFPIQVTKGRFPAMLHVGDITKLNGTELEPVDVVAGGSPCQDLSVAGKRAGLAGARSGLYMEQIRVIKEMRNATAGEFPRFMLWENVPGAFSSNGGEDFRAVLEEAARVVAPACIIPLPPRGKWSTAGAMAGDGWSIAWRVLDAQHWGVPQRRRRIFLVADFGGQSAPEILFKREGLRRYSAESGEAREGAAGGAAGGVGEPIGFSYKASAGAGTIGCATELAPSLLGARHDAAVCYDHKDLGRRNAAFDGQSATLPRRMDGSPCIDRGPQVVAVRRLTPLECERLQGFPDGWTNLAGASDSARYKALGNSVAVPCVEYVMEGIAEVLRQKKEDTDED